MQPAQVACRLLHVVSVIMLTLCGGSAHAHGHEELLGHHWEIPAYINEVRFQLVLMGAAACVIALFKLVNARKRRIRP